MDAATHDSTRRQQVDAAGGGATPRSLNATTGRGIPEFTDLLFACRYRPWQTLFAGVLFSSLLFSLSWWLTEPLYQANALVRVREQQDVVFVPQTSRAADNAFFYSQEKLALSPQVLEAALHRGNVQALSHALPAHNQVSWLRDRLQVKTQSGAEVMSIAASHSSAQIAQALASAVTESYLQEVTTRLTRDRELREQELERAAHEADRKLDELWNELNLLAQSLGSESTQSLTIRDELQYQAYRDYARQLRAAQAQGADLQRLLEEQRAVVDTEVRDNGLLIETLLQQHPDVIAARGRVSATEQQIREMSQIAAQNDSPRLQRLKQDLEFYQQELERTAESVRPKLEQRATEQSRGESEAALAQLKKQIELNRAEKDYLRQRLSELDQGIARGDQRSGVNLDKARHAVERQSRLADGLWQSLQELRIERQSQPRVSLIELAELPVQPSRSRQIKLAGSTWIAGWLLAVLAIGFIEWRGCRVRSLEDLTMHTPLPVYGADVLINGSAFVLGRRNTQSGASEAAARLILEHDGSHAKTVMVAGCDAHELNHQVAIELATSLARFQQRTLLIDSDAASLNLTRLFDAEALPGVRQVTTVATDVSLLIQPTSVAGVDMLPAGFAEDEQGWIDPRALRDVIENVRDDYDMVIICGPAILASAETLLLAARVDQVLFSVFVGTTRWNQLLASQQSALESGITVGGCIVHRGTSDRNPTPSLRSPRSHDGHPQANPERSSSEEVIALQQECESLRAEIHQARSNAQSRPNAQSVSGETV